MNFRITAPILYKITKKFLKIATEGVKTREKFKNWMTKILIRKNEKTGFKIIKMVIQNLKKGIL
jgi:hypothetical protein